MRFTLSALFLVAFLHSPVHADDANVLDRWGQLTIDNDVIDGGDEGYTGGFAVSWGYAGLSEFSAEVLPAWIHYLTENTYISTLPNRRRAIAYRIGMMAFTPDDTDSRDIIDDDRPYAGLLLWSGELFAFNDKQADRLGLQLGVVGPASGVEHLQDFIHDLVSSDKSNGWDNQLDNEPVIRLEAERMWRLKQGRLGSNEFDTIGMVQAGAGNLRSDVGAGAVFRVGKNLSDTWATATAAPSMRSRALPGQAKTSWQIFFSVYGRFVANDVTIDGNTWEDSHSVSLEHAQAFGTLGFAFVENRWGVLFAYHLGTDEFEEQDYDTSHGSVSVTYRF